MVSVHTISSQTAPRPLQPLQPRSTSRLAPARGRWLWGLVALLALVDVGWIAGTDFRLRLTGWVLPSSAFLVLSGLAWVYTHLRRLPEQRIAQTAQAGALLIAYTAVAAPLSYLVTSLALPLQDARLMHMDAWLGFSWPVWAAWIRAHPGLQTSLAVLYHSSLPQIAVVLLLLGVSGHVPAMRALLAGLILTSLPIILLSGLLPAASAWVAWQQDLTPAYHLAHFTGLRDGTYRILAATDMVGLITFPSFHTAIALVLPWACRGIPWLWWPVVLLNGGVLLSIPSEGGHYLTDMVVAAVLTGVVCWRLQVQRRGHAGEQS